MDDESPLAGAHRQVGDHHRFASRDRDRDLAKCPRAQLALGVLDLGDDRHHSRAVTGGLGYQRDDRRGIAECAAHPYGTGHARLEHRRVFDRHAETGQERITTDQDRQAGPRLDRSADVNHAGLNCPADRGGDLGIAQIDPGLCQSRLGAREIRRGQGRLQTFAADFVLADYLGFEQFFAAGEGAGGVLMRRNRPGPLRLGQRNRDPEALGFDLGDHLTSLDVIAFADQEAIHHAADACTDADVLEGRQGAGGLDRPREGLDRDRRYFDWIARFPAFGFDLGGFTAAPAEHRRDQQGNRG